MICKIRHWRPRGNQAKPCIEGSKLTQERLKGRLTQPSLLRTRRILERLQTIQNQQGSTMGDELRESFALLPSRSEAWIWVTEPTKRRINKFIGRRGVAAGALP